MAYTYFPKTSKNFSGGRSYANNAGEREDGTKPKVARQGPPQYTFRIFNVDSALKPDAIRSINRLDRQQTHKKP